MDVEIEVLSFLYRCGFLSRSGFVNLTEASLGSGLVSKERNKSKGINVEMEVL